MAKDYYSVLGVEKKASKDEIKKAFHKLAHKHHPDKPGGNDAKFKEVNEAYQILSDDKKRAQYDQYGQTFDGGAGPGAGYGGGFDPSGFGGFQWSGSAEGFDMNDLGDIFGDFFNQGQGRSRTRRGRDISTEITISFRDAVFGVERHIVIGKVSQCDTCDGSGAKPGTKLSTCKSCNGKGTIHETKRTILGSFATEVVCSTCRGQGKIPDEQCGTCRGAGVRKADSEITVHVPAGIADGQVIRMTGMGEGVAQGEAGDLYIKINVSHHAYIRREGSNLVINHSIKLTDAILGASHTIETLDGPVTIKIPEGINHGDILRIKEKGVTTGRGKRGDFLVKVSIDIPKKLSKKALEEIKKLREEGY
jgi:molecular chaperone DnaJ